MKKRTKYKMYISVLLVGMIYYYYSLPATLFNVEYSTLVESESGTLLGGHIAPDGQWRFPQSDSLPQYFKDALICFEDKRFYSHIGVDPLSIGRATFQNIRERRIASGASTLSMQVIRLSQSNPPRTFWAKIREMILATRLELKYSKEEILIFWATHAPMGGNVIGLEAASWRYYGKSPHLLTQAEAATLAILPNAPSLIHPGKNRNRLLKKRNRLLRNMLDNNYLDQLNYELALLEKIPQAPRALPRLAPHLTDHLSVKLPGKRHRTSISAAKQRHLMDIASTHYLNNKGSDIQNLAILLVDVQSGEVLSYIGNAPQTMSEQNVDMIRAPRSSGSVLKPLLYAAMVDEGKIAPAAVLPDVPIQLNGFRPSNYHKDFSGAVAADEALSRSLNIPSVLMLKEYGVARFLNRLKETGINTINKTSDHYGLSLIIGGAEVNLWELTGAYGRLARDLNNYIDLDSEYIHYQDEYPSLFNQSGVKHNDTLPEVPVYSAGAIYHTFDAMKKLERPDVEGQWDQFYSQRPLSWKTGTSFGHRDAWAVGVNAKYAIGVWVGNADGEGKSGLVGVQKAGPLLFDVVNRIEGHRGFIKPYDDMDSTLICQQSGYLAGEFCSHPVSELISVRAKNSEICPYHERHFLDAEGERVLKNCTDKEMNTESFYILPPKMAHYYQRDHPEYTPLPVMADYCDPYAQDQAMSLVYPQHGASIYLPVNAQGEKESAVLHAVHNNKSVDIHWHLDEQYLGSTQGQHHMALQTSPGRHTLTLVDSKGERLRREIDVIY